jgi:integrase
MTMVTNQLTFENVFKRSDSIDNIIEFPHLAPQPGNTKNATVTKHNILGIEALPKKKELDHAVNAIKPKDIERIAEYFLTKPERYRGTNIRDYTLFMVGINFAERISDLLNLQVKDVINSDETIVDYFTITQKKTNEPSFIVLSPIVKEILDIYLSHRWDSKNSNTRWHICDYLFYNYREPKEQLSEQHINNIENQLIRKTPLTRKAAWEIMEKARKALGIEYKIGTHCMRKTWGRTILDNSDDPQILYRIMERYGHSKPQYTKRYLKLDIEETISFMSKSSIGNTNKLKEIYN